MNKRNLKLYAVPAIYIIAIFTFGIGLYTAQRIINNNRFQSPEIMEYVSSEIVNDNEYIPVINQAPTIGKPYTDESVAVNKTFYNLEDEQTNQEKSIILYENTYMQNSGVDYKNTNNFDIVAILDGTVIEVTKNEILGKTIKIRHNNDLVSTYQSLSEVNVKAEDIVLKGQIIGKSGTCNLYNKDYNLHFELSYQGKNIDPEKSYNKTEEEL